LSIVRPLIGRAARPVKGIYFDKTPDANWKVAWHQDLSIAVREEKAAPGFSGWSIKAGAIHVQPPAEILASMLTVRLHLDAAGDENGALRVIPGSHQHGRLDSAAIDRLVEQTQPVTCLVGKGGVLLMRPLLLHASSAAVRPTHRRVIHLEYSADTLPHGLEWRVT
jgi:ectoine hydroxylase-related dioxygenase (phytanoyl-CoA dioxygenase family)